jgi:hypothetical protein
MAKGRLPPEEGLPPEESWPNFLQAAFEADRLRGEALAFLVQADSDLYQANPRSGGFPNQINDIDTVAFLGGELSKSGNWEVMFTANGFNYRLPTDYDSAFPPPDFLLYDLYDYFDDMGAEVEFDS